MLFDEFLFDPLSIFRSFLNRKFCRLGKKSKSTGGRIKHSYIFGCQTVRFIKFLLQYFMQ